MPSLIRRLAAAFVVMAMLAGPLAASAAPARAPSPISDTFDRSAEYRQDVAAQESAPLGTPVVDLAPSIAAPAEEPAGGDESPPAEPDHQEQPPVEAPAPTDTAAEPTEAGTDEAKTNVAGAGETTNLALAANQLPVAVADAYAVEQGRTLTVDAASGLLANDTDADGDSLSAFVSSDSLPNGTLAANGDGSFVYTPNAGFVGTETFTYKASDGTFDFSNIATVTIAVSAPNHPPVAENDFYSTPRDTTLTVDAAAGLLANDSDPDGDPLTAVVALDPQHGTLSLNPDGSFTYEPEAGFVGTVHFIYFNTDGPAFSIDSGADITVTNTPPVATDNAFTTQENHPLAIGIGDDLLSDDIDNSGTGIALESTTQPAHGSINRDGDDLIYTPTAGFSGVDTFTYRIGDGVALSNFATVTIDVIPLAQNTPPVAVDDAFTTAQNTTLTVLAPGVLANDTDADGDALTATLVTDTSNGSVGFLAPDGLFSYSPNVGFFGDDTFTYQVSDGTETSAVATVTITVVPGSAPPVPQDDAYTVAQDTILTVAAAAGLLANDIDPDGDALEVLFELNSGTFHGDLSGTILDGSFTYTPDPGFVGTDTFQYRAFDGTVQTDVVTVTITVTAAGANTPPVAANDAFTALQDTPLTVVAPGVLANDSDVDGDIVSVGVITQPASGTVSLNGAGAFIYTPAPDFAGTDLFTYHAFDGQVFSEPATVTLTVGALPNTPPVANDDAYSTEQDTELNVDAVSGILANDTDADGDALTHDNVTSPAHGALLVAPDGAFEYVPEAGFTGLDSFTYTASDGLAETEPAIVTITVVDAPDNVPPVAVDDTFTIAPNTTMTIVAPGLLANDTDADGDELLLSLQTGPEHGNFRIGLDGFFSYTPFTDFVGTDRFTYRASDGTVDGNLATVTIEVTDTPANNRPIAGADAYTITQDENLDPDAAAGLLANDSDPDGDPITTSAGLVGPAHGILPLINPNGSFLYIPDDGFVGVDTFSYVASDGQLSSLETVVTITVSANDPPVAGADAYTISQDSTLTVAAEAGVLANDSDPDGDPIVAILILSDGPAHGAVTTFNDDGSFTYTPEAGFAGTDSFAYFVSDGPRNSIATVTITVTDPAANTPPVAVDDTYSVDQDAVLTVAAANGVLANDSDADGDTLEASLALATGPAHGTLDALAKDGSFRYTPDSGFAGSDTFRYAAFDPDGASNPATVTITVTATDANTPPIATNDAYGTGQDAQLTVPAGSGLLANDSDVDNDPITVETVDAPGSGTVSTDADGSFIYAPDQGFAGTDTFGYTVSDGRGGTDNATVEIVVAAASPEPSPSPAPSPSPSPAPNPSPDPSPAPSPDPSPSPEPTVPSDPPGSNAPGTFDPAAPSGGHVPGPAPTGSDPEPQPATDSINTLPNTGAGDGTQSTSAGPMLWLTISLSLAILAFAGTGIAVHQRRARR